MAPRPDAYHLRCAKELALLFALASRAGPHAEEPVEAEIVPEPRLSPPPLPRRGPAGASWDTSSAVGVPRRFGMAVVLLIMAMYALLFMTLKLLGADPLTFTVVAILFTGIGLGQMLLFGGRNPRAASVWTGAVLLPLEIAGVLLYSAAAAGPFAWPEVVSGLICAAVAGAPFGAAAGYLAGVLAAGVFLLIEMHGKPRTVAAEVDVIGDLLASRGDPGAASPACGSAANGRPDGAGPAGCGRAAP